MEASDCRNVHFKFPRSADFVLLITWDGNLLYSQCFTWSNFGWKYSYCNIFLCVLPFWLLFMQ